MITLNVRPDACELVLDRCQCNLTQVDTLLSQMKRKLNAGPELILSYVDPICKSIWRIQARYNENINYKCDIRSYSRSEGKGFFVDRVIPGPFLSDTELSGIH